MEPSRGEATPVREPHCEDSGLPESTRARPEVESDGPALRSRPTRVERWLLTKLLNWFHQAPLRFEFWDGSAVQPVPGACLARLRVRDRTTLWKLLLDPLFQFGDCYTSGSLIVAGDLTELLTALNRQLSRPEVSDGWGQRLMSLWHPPHNNTLPGSRRNIHRHYDLGNAFYRLWLDSQLIYTCAYFNQPGMTLESAQVAKLDYVCRKLRLRPEENVVEAGCGWGALSLHMARHYGVRVKAFNISRAQIDYARERAAREGLEDRVEFIEDDWRNITSSCDAFISVGMLEHVGRQGYRQLGGVIDKILSSRGRGLIHSIGRNRPVPMDGWTESRIFPGAYPPSLREMLSILEPFDMTVWDVENLGPHYTETLKHWLQRFEAQAAKVERMFDARFVRMWRFYLAGSVATFLTGGLQLFQVVFSRRGDEPVPSTRAALYAPDNDHVETGFA